MSQKSIIKFVAELQDLGIKLSIVDGELKVKAPKGSLQGERLDRLKEHKEDVHEYLLSLQAAQLKSKSKITKADRNSSAPIPLSYGQQRLWFLNQFNKGSAFYNMPMVLKVEGQLNSEHFEESVQAIISRYEILRTNFLQEQNDEGSVHQIIHDHIDWHIDHVDFSLEGLKKEDAQEKIRAKIAQLCLKPFDLEKDHLFRIHLVKVSDELTYCVNVVHHIIGDAWSSEILVRELVASYLFGSSALPRLEIQYADYAQWQRSWLSGDVLQKQIDFWRRELRGVPALQMPFDRLRPKVESHRGGRVKLEINEDLYKKLKQFSEQQGATLFMSLMAAFQILLARYSGQEDFAVGTPIANRDKEELANQIGFFINTLALRSSIDKKDSFNSLIKKVKSRLLNAYSHQELPFEHIVEALSLERNTSHAPIFQNMLVLNSSSFANEAKDGIDTQALGQSELSQLKISLMESEHVSAKFDLNCELVEAENKLRGHIEFNRDLYDEESVEQLCEHFVHLIEVLILEPEKNIFSFSLLGGQQKNSLEKFSSGEIIAYPAFDNIDAYLDEALSAHTNNVALRVDGQSITYEDLHQQVVKLANYLQKGVNDSKSDQPIALCLERSADMVVGILAAIKLGRPYLPLDPSLPEERLQFIVADSEACVVLVHSLTSHIINSDASVINLSAEAEVIAASNTNEIMCSVEGRDLFNIIYTSGSTGNPKGVMVTHEGILNRIQWMQSEYGLKPENKVLQKTTYSFDVSVWEFIWPLSQGACLVLASPEGHKDPAYLNQIMRDESISHCHFVPSMLSAWLSFGGDDIQLPELQKVFCSGEALSREAVNQFYETLTNSELHNLYGPTEAAIDVSYWACEKGESITSRVPIGKPVANTQLYVLDSQGQLAPPGVAGELHIGGVQLARGYLNRDDLTSTTFIQHTLNNQEQRLYKTGDLVRQRRDGVIDYLGRIDHQVKVRGYRIELGEIETRLQEVEGVELSVVVAAGLNQEQQLVAYVSQESVKDDTADDKADKDTLVQTIKTALGKHLPAYMVPSVVMVLDEIPLLNNGKIDRKRLPKAEVEQAEFIAPSTETELVLASIWQEVLGVEQIGILDNFFELRWSLVISHACLVSQKLQRSNWGTIRITWAL